jgi:O-acetylserine/cysteine efflux transporter
MLSYVVWSSLFSAPPLFAMSYEIEGWPAIRDGLANADAAVWATVAYQSLGNTIFGFATWGWLLSRYPAATIAPLSLLIPVVGMTTATLWLGEPMQAWKLAAAALVISGVCVNLLWPKYAAIRARRHPPAA